MTGALARGRSIRRPHVPSLTAASWILGATAAAGGLNYLYSLGMTGLLRPSHYSVFAAGQAIALVTGTVANTSVPWLLAREISRASDDARARGVVWFAAVLNLVVGLGAGALTLALSAGFADLAVMGWLAGATLSFFVASTGMGWAQGHQRFGLLAVLILAEVAIKVVVGLALVAAGAGPAGAFAAAVIGALAITLVMLRPMWRELKPARAVLGSRRLWRSAAGMGAVQAGVTLISVIDVLFISLRFGATREVAGYQVAATLTRAPLFIALALATAAFPQLARRPGDRALLSGHSQHVLSVLLPLLVVIATLPRPVITAVLPAGYDSAARFLPLTAALSTAYGLLVLQTTVFRADDRARECLVILAGACLTSLACMAVGSTFGPYGLACGALVGALLAVGAFAVQIERRWHGAQRVNMRPLLIWVAVAVALVFARAMPWLWLCLAGAVALQTVRAALSAPDRPMRLGTLEQ